MHTNADKETKNESRAAAWSLAGKNRESSLSFIDNRAEAITQRRIQELIDGSKETRETPPSDDSFLSDELF